MSDRENLKQQVKILRAKGKTYSEITKKLRVKIPRSTMSDWCRNVVMPKWYLQKVEELNKKSLGKAQQASLVSNKIKREQLLKSLSLNNAHLANKINDKDILKIVLAILYLGEGAKWKSHRGLMLGSSDPNIIKLYLKLLNRCYSIKSNKLGCRISYRADQNINQLQKFWSQTTKIPLPNFYKTIPDPRTIGKTTKNKEYKGVCVITCAGTNIQLELEMIPKIILKGL